jgi:hypothetical protein
MQRTRRRILWRLFEWELRAAPSDRPLRHWLFERMLREVALEGKYLRAALRKQGIDGVPYVPGSHYVPDFYGRSSHELPDIRSLPVFGELAEEVVSSGRSLLYYDRLSVLYHALESVRRVTEGRGGPLNLAEVGVYRGGTTHFIAASARFLGLASAAVHAFDTFTGHTDEDVLPEHEDQHAPGKFKSTDFESVREFLKIHPNVKIHAGRFQDTCGAIEALRFSFVHLDVDLYAPTYFALQFFDPRLTPGATIVVDDYQVTTCLGVKRAVDEFLEKKRRYAAFPLLTGQCVLVRVAEPGGAGDAAPLGSQPNPGP